MEQIATPAIIIDSTIVERNIKRMAAYAEQQDLDLRPHTKTHKSRDLAAAQMAAGAIGLTVAKVGEAEVLSEVGSDLLLAYPAIDPARTGRLAKLARHFTIRVAVDSVEAAEALAVAARRTSSTIGILVDIDVGQHRTGLQTPAAALKLAQFIDRAAGIRLDGIMCYPGHIWLPPAEQTQALEQVSDILVESLDLWAKHGLEARIISGGSTPTAYQSHLVPEYTEIRPGTYIFNDLNTVRGGFCSLDDCAATDRLHGGQHGRAGPVRVGCRQQDPVQRSLRTGPGQRPRADLRISGRPRSPSSAKSMPRSTPGTASRPPSWASRSR